MAELPKIEPVTDDGIESVVTLITAAEILAGVLHVSVAQATRMMLQSIRAIQQAGALSACEVIAFPQKPTVQ